MMFKNLILSLFISCSIFGQDIKKEINIALPKKSDLFQIMNEKENEFLFFLSRKEKITAFRFNESFEIKDSMNYVLPSKNKYNVEGYGMKNNKYYIYWTNDFNQEMMINSVDFSTKKIENSSFSPKQFEGRIISRLTINNNYYIITLVKNTNLINVYKFDGFDLTKKNLDLSGTKFIDENNKVSSLWQMFNYSTNFETAFSVQTISQETPPSLPLSANKRKLYIKDNLIFFTLDQHNKFTQTFSINLDNFEVKHKVYNKPFVVETEFANVDSNSFIFEDNILLLKTIKEKLIIDIRHLGGDLIKTLEAINSVDIPFQNSEIIQESNSVKNRRVLGKSNQFLRKTSNLNCALSCYSVDDRIYMTLGGVSVVQSDGGAAFAGGLMFGFAGALIFSAILSSNYSNNNLNSYNQRNVIYINSIFDRSFNHINEPVKKLPFDELRYFVEGKQNEISTVFKFKKDLYFCNYEDKKKSLIFYEFKNQ